MVSLLHKEWEYKVKNLSKSWRSCSGGSKTNLNFQLVNKTSQISPHELLQSWLVNTFNHLLVKNNNGEGRGLKRRGSRHLKLYSRKWSLIQMSLKKHSLYNLNWPCFEHRVACASKPCRVVLQLLWLCKIIEKSVMGESFFFCLTRLDPWLDSQFTQESRIVNQVENRDSQWTVNFLLNSTVIEDLLYFQRLIHQNLPGPLQNLPPSVVICWSPLS